MNQDVIHVVARAVCRPDKTAEMIEVLSTVAERSRTEPGCLGYDVLHATENPHEVITLEKWRDKDAIDAHFKTPYVQDLFARVPDLVTQTPEIKTYVVAGEEHRRRLTRALQIP